MQTVSDLLEQFDLKLDLTDAILSIEVPGEFDSYRIESDKVLRFENSKKGFLDYGKFKAYVFENDDVYVCIAPDNAFEHLTIYEKLMYDDMRKLVGGSYDAFGRVSVRT